MPVDPARRLADELHRRGLAAPGRLLADAHRPLAPLLSDLGAAIAPLLRSVSAPGDRSVSAFIEDPDALDRLVHELDAEEPRAEPG
jgi:hypothetical protein